MPTREEMQSLGQEIAGSYEARKSGIDMLRKGVASQMQAARDELQDVARAHQTMARRQRAILARGRAGLSHNVADQLKSLDATHQGMAHQLRTGLARGRTGLANSVAGQLKDLDVAHQAMAGQQHSGLTAGRAELAGRVARLLKQADATHQSVARQQRADLAKGVADRKSSVSGLLGGFDAKLGEMRSSIAGGRDEWQRFSAMMQAKRGAQVTDAPKTAAPPAVEAASSIEPAEPMTAGATDSSALSDRVFEYLASHPDGARMTELEMEFGISRVQMARVLRNLMDDNKVEKRDLLYFAV